ncbi:Probable inactive purple acid phosphatase [Seminavis robusta]|uniref:Probable inactive purple acid phosphatase n=1 Tax=Seminavis robusta TaxID=568900 RepID=A0A9N8E3L8_9STRA|nr:Probable inactive purple acid phosphatase [Seminavis robusta]|eukprot:Sro510_g157240.1 Probable inactive purple acid phosphatase (423) ;mRNA; r:27549-28979
MLRSAASIHRQRRSHAQQAQWCIFKCALCLLPLVLIALFLHPRLSVLKDTPTGHHGHHHGSPYKLEFRQVSSLSSTAASSARNNKAAVFKILQLADIHLGEAEDTDWGPRQDSKTWRLMDRVITLERPDLIVLSGDQLTANNVDQNATTYYRLLGQHLSYYGVPWAMIFGNHDDANLYGTNETKTSREELLAMDQQFPLSLSQSTPGLFGTSNYKLNVHYPSKWFDKPVKGKDDVVLQLFFLDSGGGVLPQTLEQNQIQWFQKEHRSDVEGVIVFQHIPTAEFVYRDGDVCHGLHDDPVDSIRPDPGIVQTLQEAGNVQWLASGHDHGNDYCCSTKSKANVTTNGQQHPNGKSRLHLCFGRHSGYGGYGQWSRGARVYEISLQRKQEQSSTVDMALSWKSWVRNETGSVLDPYEPFEASAGP